MGSTLQFRTPGQFTPIADLLGGGHWQLPRGAWTDDTAMSLCLAESLLATDGFNAADQFRRFRQWQQDGYLSSTGACIGITAAVASVLQRDAGGRRETGVADVQAITRVGVAVLFSISAPARALGWAADAAAVTDTAPQLREACRYFAALLLAALSGCSRESLSSDARAVLQAHGEPSEHLRFDRWLADGQGTQATDAALVNTPLAAVHRALSSLLGTAGFREGLLQTVNRGGDSDVQGALFGQLAGALYGVQGIPKAWNRALLRRDLLEDVADRLLVAGLAPRD